MKWWSFVSFLNLWQACSPFFLPDSHSRPICSEKQRYSGLIMGVKCLIQTIRPCTDRWSTCWHAYLSFPSRTCIDSLGSQSIYWFWLYLWPYFSKFFFVPWSPLFCFGFLSFICLCLENKGHTEKLWRRLHPYARLCVSFSICLLILSTATVHVRLSTCSMALQLYFVLLLVSVDSLHG